MDDRPSAWLAGAGLGLCLGSGVLLAAYAGHVMPDLGQALGLFLGLFTFGLGSAPFAEWGARGLWAAISTVAEALNSWGAPGMPGNQEIQPQISTQDEFDAERHAWNTALSRFFRAGDTAGGFSIRKLGGIVGSDAWARLTTFYCSEDGNRVLRVGPGDQGTMWGWGWNLDIVLQRIGTGDLPCPAGAVPDVEIYIQNTTQQPAKRRATTARPATQAVIDN